MKIWHQWLDVRVRAMTRAGKYLVLAGTPDAFIEDDPYACGSQILDREEFVRV